MKKYLSLSIAFVLMIVSSKAQVEIVSTGTSSAYTLTVPSSFALRNGIQITFKAHTTCVASPTLNVNGTGALTITKEGISSVLSAGDIKAGQVVTLAYDGTGWQMLTQIGNAVASSVSGTTNQVIKFTSATAGGNSQITDDGTNVGVGTTTPAVKFEVFNATNPQMRLKTTAGSGTVFDYSNTSFSILNYDNTPFYIGTGAGGVRMNIQANGDVGIGNGIFTPSAKLHVIGGARITNLVGPGTVVADAAGNLSIAAGGSITGSGTTNYVARWTPTGSQLGIGVLQDNGTNVLPSSNNVSDLGSSPTSWKNMYLDGRLYVLDVPWTSVTVNNTFIGIKGNESITSGLYNLAVGEGSGRAINTGFRNTAVGHRAGELFTGSSDNTLLGNLAGGLTSNLGSNNTLLGSYAGYGVTNTGSDNTFVGTNVGGNTTSGSLNTSIGSNSSYNTTTANNSVYVGYNAGQNVTTGSNNVFIGYNAGLTNATQRTNAIAIGYNATVNADNAMVLGGVGAGAVRVGIGTTTPAENLQISSTSSANISLVGVSTGSNKLYFGSTAFAYFGAVEYHNTNHSMNFWTNNTPNRIFIDINGNVGINNAAPGRRLDVIGDARISSLVGPGTVIADASGNLSVATGGTITGTGTTNYVAKWTPSGTQLGIGLIYDNNSVVGIGTGASPSASRLHVHSTSGNGNLRLTSASTGLLATDGFSVSNDGTTEVVMTQHENANWYFSTNGGSVAMTILPSTNVGVGTITPDAKFNVDGTWDLGTSNIVTGVFSGAIGSSNTVAGNRALAFGNFTSAANLGSMTFGDWGGGGPTVLTSSTSDQFSARFNGGYRFFTDGTLASTQAIYFSNVGKIGLGVPAPLEAIHAASTDTDFDLETYSTTESSSLHLKRGRGTVAAPTAPVANDYYGGVGFQAWNGASFQEGARIQGVVDGTPNATSMPGRIEFWTTPVGSNTAIERMEINNIGNVGIGSPAVANVDLYVTRSAANTGANNSTIFGIRPGVSGNATAGGTAWGFTGVDAAVKGSSGWGNTFSAGVAGYNYLADYTGVQVAGVIGVNSSNTAVYGALAYRNNNIDYAGYFSGNVTVTGTVAKGGGTFKIDHPLDPENKYLYHSFVESPDMMNIYNGNIITDANGIVEVILPDYFEALNMDFRYQLTVIGSFAQAIILEKVNGNKFKIKTDKPSIEVSWQVTGVRKDPFANKNRVIPEVEKDASDKGKYLHPEAYGLPFEKSIGGFKSESGIKK